MDNSLLAEIEAHYRDTYPYTGMAELSPRIRDAMAEVERAEFVPRERLALAHCDSALPIGCGQTISQPFIVALMTQLMATQPYHRVLEIGTGSGYQAAVLSRLVAQVYSVEIIPELADGAASRLQRLGYDNVAVRCADGYEGWEDEAPFDGAMITASVAEIPPQLIAQVRQGGRIVAPVGGAGNVQQLVVAEKTAPGAVESRKILPVSFVPFTRAH